MADRAVVSCKHCDLIVSVRCLPDALAVLVHINDETHRIADLHWTLTTSDDED